VKLEDLPVATEQLPVDEVKLGQLKMVVWAEAGSITPSAISPSSKYLFVSMFVDLDLHVG
jgi:hypothetical protein